MEQNFSWPRDVENNAIGPDGDAEKVALVTGLMDRAFAESHADLHATRSSIDYPPSPGDEQQIGGINRSTHMAFDDQIDQQKRGWYMNQPHPTALREILMYTRHIQQQLEFIEAAVRRLENL